jgi:exodeoxyribonuclease VII small subunit
MTEADDLTQLTYEQAFAELQGIVDSLEKNQGSLEENMALFERGQKLARYCADLLEKAELKVRELNTHAPSAGEIAE